MIASTFKGAAAVAAYCKRRRRLRFSRTPVMVNLGSFLIAAPGWINIDGSHHIFVRRLPIPLLRQLYRHSQAAVVLSEAGYIETLKTREFIHHDLRYGIPFHGGSCDFIYSSHFLEHLYESEARFLLEECHRVLKPDGVLRLCVPDLARAVSLYQEGRKREALDYFFTRSNAHAFERHKFMYDFDLLREILYSTGFGYVEKCEFQKGRVPNLDLLDNRPRETLFVEAVR